MNLITVYIPTQEDWYGSYEIDGKLWLRLELGKFYEGAYRVGVWGTDDFGMVRDFVDYDSALSVFHDLCALPHLRTQKLLVEKGFLC